MKLENVANGKLGSVSGGSEEKFYNTCKECGKVWDMREYGYGSEDPMPNWVTGPWCRECREKLLKNSKDSI